MTECLAEFDRDRLRRETGVHYVGQVYCRHGEGHEGNHHDATGRWTWNEDWSLPREPLLRCHPTGGNDLVTGVVGPATRAIYSLMENGVIRKVTLEREDGILEYTVERRGVPRPEGA